MKIMIFLSGGHVRSFDLADDDPIISEIIASLASNASGENSPNIFHIGADGGRRSFFFAAKELIAVETDPMLEVQQRLGDLEQ